MDLESATPSRVTNYLVVAGLKELRPFYGGLGRTVEILADMVARDAYETWSLKVVRQRVNRALWNRIEAHVSALPGSAEEWNEAIPASSIIGVRDSDRVAGSVDWARSAVVHGWPPKRLVVRERNRVPNTLLLAVLRWIVARVNQVVLDAERLAPGVTRNHAFKLDLLKNYSDLGLESTPSALELEAVRREGGVWISISKLAGELLWADQNPDELLLALLEVDSAGAVAGRVFQLATLGLIVSWFRTHGQVQSLRPIGVGGRAVFRVSSRGGIWDVWFEAAFPGRLARRRSLYSAARAGIPSSFASLRVDMVLLPVNSCRGLVVECKDSANANYVASGFTQALGYLVEADNAEIAMDAIVVGPAGSVNAVHWVSAMCSSIAIVDTSMLDEALDEFVASSSL